MSEINAPVIVRNEVSKTLTPTAFGKKSPNAGVPFFYPKLNGDTFESDVQWAGLQYILDVANKALRNTFAGLHLDHWNKETGQLNTEAWAADAADFTAGVTKLSDLKEEDYRLVDLIGALTDKASDENVTETETITLMQEIKGLSDQIREIRKQIKGIEAKYAERAAKRAATEAEKAPATA